MSTITLKKYELINELKKGEVSGFVDKFNRNSFLNKIHVKHIAEKGIRNNLNSSSANGH